MSERTVFWTGVLIILINLLAASLVGNPYLAAFNVIAAGYVTWRLWVDYDLFE